MVYGEQWEYKVIELDWEPKKREKQLNHLGFQGWELAAVTAYEAYKGWSGTPMRYAYLKRKKV
ncbi:MAG: DUF4177 domain-containing protein [Candidatus Nealsonbacteria bacterium]|nr:MAG: DUF4177 domain-containing protein [Candidatus Nealsonbacteria bacterium]